MRAWYKLCKIYPLLPAGAGLLQRPGAGGRHPDLAARLPAQPAHPPAHVPQEQAQQQAPERAHPLQRLSLQEYVQVGYWV